MSRVPIIASVGTTIAAGTTRFFSFGTGQPAGSATESDAQQTMRDLGTVKSLWVAIATNSASTTTTIKTRKNGVGGNLTLSVAAGVTGVFEDQTSVDTVASGDTFNFAIQVPAGTGSVLVATVTSIFDSTSGLAVLRSGGLRPSGRSFSVASTANYISMSDNLNTGQLEANCQSKILSPCTLKNLYAKITVNTQTTATSIVSRVGGANGALAISVGAGVTGVFEDTTNSDSLVSGNLVCLQLLTGAGTGAVTATAVAATTISTNNIILLPFGSNNTITAATAVNYQPLGGGYAGSSTTEANFRTKMNVAGKLSNMSVFVSANSLTATSTIKLRKNGVDGNQVLSIGSGVTGYIEDSVNVDYVVESDLVGRSFLVGTTGTSITLQAMGSLLNLNAPNKVACYNQAINRAGTY